LSDTRLSTHPGKDSVIVLGHILLVVGLTTALAGYAMFLAVVFNRSLWWFFGCLFIPFVDVVFLVLNFKFTAKPFGIAVLGLVVAGLGDYLTGNIWFS
jgi:hypothetical protein